MYSKWFILIWRIKLLIITHNFTVILHTFSIISKPWILVGNGKYRQYEVVNIFKAIIIEMVTMVVISGLRVHSSIFFS